MDGNNVTNFDGFGTEHMPKEIIKFVGKKNIMTISIQCKHTIR